MKKALVIIPAYNEAPRIKAVLEKIPREFDVLVINDASTDATASIARNYAKVLFNSVNLGVGASVRKGFEYALKKNYASCIVVNADGQHPPDLIKEFVAKLGEYEAVTGTRFATGEPRMPFLRRLGNKFFAFLVNSLYGTSYSDVTCGMRAFRTSILPRILSEEKGYGVEIDMSIKMRKLKARELAIPAICVEKNNYWLPVLFIQLLWPVVKNKFAAVV